MPRASTKLGTDLARQPTKDETEGVRPFVVEERPELAAALTSYHVPSQRVWGTSVVLLENIAQGLAPRPADDVVGSNWNRTR